MNRSPLSFLGAVGCGHKQLARFAPHHGLSYDLALRVNNAHPLLFHETSSPAYRSMVVSLDNARIFGFRWLHNIISRDDRLSAKVVGPGEARYPIWKQLLETLASLER